MLEPRAHYSELNHLQLKRYWLFQVFGWGIVHLLLATQSFQAFETGQETLARILILSPTSYLSCVFASHLIYLLSIKAQITNKASQLGWQKLLPIIILVSLLVSIFSWIVLVGVDLYYPPPSTRTELISSLFNSFLGFILNFTLVNFLLLSLWWVCFLFLSNKPQSPTKAISGQNTDLDPSSPVMISDGRQSKLITPSHIEYIFSEGNYIKLVGVELNMLIRNTLSHVESRLSKAGFFRANRQTLINLMKVKSIDEAMSGNSQWVGARQPV